MIAIILGRAAQFLLALATLRAATTLLSPDEMGKVSLILTTTACFAMFLVNPVGMFINRRLHAWQAKGLAYPYLKLYSVYLGVVALFAAIVLPILDKSGWVGFAMPAPWLVGLVCGSLIFNTVNQTSIPSLNMLGDSRSFVVLTVTTLAVSFICAVALVDMVHAAAQYWVLGLLLGQTVLAVVGTRLLFAKLNMRGNASIVVQDLNKRHFQTLLEFAWPVALAAGLGWVQGQGYRYILESQLGLAQLGLFVAGYGISAGVIAGFESVLTTYFQPRLYRDANCNGPKEQSEAWRRYASAVVPSLIITTALVVILAPELTRIFLGERFQAASDYVVWGALAESARVLAGVYSLIAHVFMRTRWLVLPTAVGAAVAIAACVALLPHMGAAGVGLGLTLAGIAVVALLHLSLVFRVGGGVATSLIWKALAGGGAVWGGVLVVRHIWSHESWGEMASAIAVGGALYLAFLYLFLHRHLMEE